MKKKIAFITGITGQDGSYLAEFLIKKNYIVHGLRRRSSIENLSNLNGLKLIPQDKKKNLFLHYGDMNDSSSLNKILSTVKPDEIYNLAAQSHVHLSFAIPEYTADVNALGCLRLLEAMRIHCPKAKFYQASTSELYGNSKEIPQNEKTIMSPISPYAISKLYAYNIVKDYRMRGFYCSNGILFNHESPRRGSNFVTKKIIEAAVKIKNEKQDVLFLGNLYSKRDWGYAGDYVQIMWKILQQKKSEDFVIATGKSYTIKYFVEKTFLKLGIKIIWKNKGIKEIGLNSNTKKTIIKIDPFYFRKNEVNYLLGDPSKAIKKLKWKNQVNINQLIDIMLAAEIDKRNTNS